MSVIHACTSFPAPAGLVMIHIITRIPTIQPTIFVINYLPYLIGNHSVVLGLSLSMEEMDSWASRRPGCAAVLGLSQFLLVKVPRAVSVTQPQPRLLVSPGGLRNGTGLRVSCGSGREAGT